MFPELHPDLRQLARTLMPSTAIGNGNEVLLPPTPEVQALSRADQDRLKQTILALRNFMPGVLPDCPQCHTPEQRQAVIRVQIAGSTPLVEPSATYGTLRQG